MLFVTFNKRYSPRRKTAALKATQFMALSFQEKRTSTCHLAPHRSPSPPHASPNPRLFSTVTSDVVYFLI